MTELNNVVDILTLLDKSNCKECGEPTCLAFASTVFKGEKDLSDCTHLDKEILERYEGKTKKRKSVDEDMMEAVEQLKNQVAKMDLASAADRVGGRWSQNRLTVRILGKDFSIDTQGNLYTDIHVNPWATIPLLNYVLYSAGRNPTGEWIPFRELKGGKEWYGLFEQRCEKPLKKIADTYTGLFEDMLNIFNGKQVERHYESDISLVLHPLPKVPILICYWKPEDGMGSDLTLFFDITAHDNLPTQSIYTLVTGLVTMFEKIALRHGS